MARKRRDSKTTKAKSAAAPGSLWRAEWFLGFSLATTAVFALSGESIYARLDNPLWLAFVFAWLFGTVMASALAVVRHADHVAELLGEPYGTLVLTLSVTAIEVMSITAVMLHGDNNPTLVRDTLFAIVMIILGGMVGVALLAGGWRYREQHYNLQSANTYLSVIIPLALLTLSLPNFTVTTPGPTLSTAQQAFLVVVSIGLYCAFLATQTGRHRRYFMSEEEAAEEPSHAATGGRGLAGANEMLLAVTLAVSVVTFASGRTNILQGAVHVVLFAAFVILIFQG